MSAPQHFYLVTANPRPADHIGQVEEGWFILKGDTVILTDASGTPLLGEGDHPVIEGNPLITAKRALRARLNRRPRSDFNRRLVYPATGL
jgi:hypothetical protein